MCLLTLFFYNFVRFLVSSNNLNMKKFILLCVFAMTACITAFAQQTAYEKKVYEICVKYYSYCKYGDKVELNEEDMLTINKFGAKKAALLSLMNYAVTHDS